MGRELEWDDLPEMPDYVMPVVVAQQSSCPPWELFDDDERQPSRRFWRLAMANVVEAQGIANKRLTDRMKEQRD